MPKPSLDNLSSDGSSRLPLEILLPVSASLLISLAITVFFAHRIRLKKLSKSKQFVSSPSVLVLSDLEANRQWLLNLRRLKDLGLDQMKRAKRSYSLHFEAKRKSLWKADVDPTFFGLPTRPRSIFLPRGRPHSTPRAVIRQSWVQNLLHSSYDRLIGSRSCAANDAKATPEIRVTVPSTTADGVTALPRDRRWSQIIARDIGLSLHEISKTKDPDVSASHASDRSSHGNGRHLQHPPNSMDTLPPPARRRLSCAALTESSPKRSATLCNHFRTLSPIKETCESLNVYNSSSLCSVNEVTEVNLDASALSSKSPEDQDTLTSACGEALLNSSDSLRSTSNGSSDVQISQWSSHSEGFDNVISVAQKGRISPAETQQEFSTGFSAESLQESQTALSPVEAYNSGHITLSDMSADSPSIAMNWTPQARRFFVYNPDISLAHSSSATSLHIPTLESDQSPLPIPLIPSAFVDATTPRSSSQVPASPISVLKSDGSGSLAISCSTDRESRRVSKSLAGVELWIDEDTDLFYCPGSVDSRT